MVNLAVFLFLLAIIPDKGEASCVEKDIDYFGYDLVQYHNTASWEVCSSLCRDSPKCKVWTWLSEKYSDPAGRRKCHLKYSDSGRQSVSNAYSGHQRCGDNATFTVLCHELFVTGIWKKYTFVSGNVEVTLNDPSCHDYKENKTHIWITAKFKECGSIIQENSNLIFQENTAVVTITSGITVVERKIHYTYNMRCIFDRSINVSSSNSFNASDASGGVFNGSAVTRFNASMAIYDSSSFLIVAVNPFTVTSFQPIFIGITEMNKNENFKFIVNQCFATPSSSRYGHHHYMFFDLKCPIDRSFKILYDGSNHFNFQIDAFRFIEIRKSVYIHCNLYICNVNATSPACTQKCGDRKRRAISEESTIEELPLKEVSVKTDKIVFKKKSVCDEISCPPNSYCLQLYPAQCRCKEGYVFHSKTGACNEERVFDIHGLHLEMDFISTFSDPTSTDFLKLATDIEKELTALFRLEDERIEGVKVISAREGSVVLDLAIIYAKTSTKEEAFDSFVKSIMANHTQTTTNTSTSNTITSRRLKIKREIIPTIAIQVLPPDNTILIIAIILPTVLVIVVGIVALAIRCKWSQNQEIKHIKGFENDGISMEKSS